MFWCFFVHRRRQHDMAGIREVSLFLKYPGPTHALQRLQHSYLECVLEYKTGSEAELQSKLPNELFSQYQIKGSAMLADDEIIVEFTPKHSGLHVVRIFSDTRELCKPVPFIVNHRGDVVNIPADRPVKRPPASPEHMQSPPHPTFYGLNNPRFPPSPPATPNPQSVVSDVSSFPQTEPPYTDHGVLEGMPAERHIRGFTSEPTLSVHAQSPYRASYLSRTSGGSRPPSLQTHIEDADAYAGDLFVQQADETTFDALYSSKREGDQLYGRRKEPLSIDYQSALTQETLRMLAREADLQMRLARGGKIKKSCNICSKKVKVTKAVNLGEKDYCDPCFRRQFLLRSAIEHFMVPSIQECNIQVPINKKATKFVTAKKNIPNVNLRGLDTSDVRFAQEEFRKFDMENNGWIKEAVLMPVLKACLAYSGVTEREAKTLLQSDALRSMVNSFGISAREEVHEIEFLALFAFTSRERERLRGNADPHRRTKFTRNDLEMAYAFRQQLGPQRRTEVAQPSRDSGVPLQRRADQRASYIPKSQTDHGISGLGPTSPPKMTAQSVRGPTNYGRPSAFVGAPQTYQHSLPQCQSQIVQQESQQYRMEEREEERVPLGEKVARRAASKRDTAVGDLPEVDQDESEELPTLPPEKDPSNHQTNPLLGKKTSTANTKQLMEELKLTGGKADAWMMY